MKILTKTFTLRLLIVLSLTLPSFSNASNKVSELITSRKCSKYFKTFENKYHMPKDIIKAIALTESGKWSDNFNRNIAWPWTINSNGRGYYLKSKKAAIEKVEELIAEGKRSIDVGCMQINLKYHPYAFENLEQAFDPKHNIGYAAEFLAKKYNRYQSWDTSIRHYHSTRKKYSDRYIKKVYSIWDKDNSSDSKLNFASLSNAVNKQYPIIYMNVKNNNFKEPTISHITKNSLITFLD